MARSSEPAREQIVAAAEQLFAERGIEGPTLREIGAAAGQRNNSAVQYHFGDRLGLLTAVLTPHLDELDARRTELLAEARARGPVTLEDLIAVAIGPLAAKLADPSGVRYLQIQATLLGTNPAGPLAAGLAEPWRRPAMGALVDEMGEVLSPLGAAEGEARRLLAVTMAFNGLANFASAHPDATPARRRAYERTLVASVVALLRLPTAEGAERPG